MLEQVFAEVNVVSQEHTYIILGKALCRQLSRLGQWDLSLDAVPTHRHDLNWLSFGFNCKFKVSYVVISGLVHVLFDGLHCHWLTALGLFLLLFILWVMSLEPPHTLLSELSIQWVLNFFGSLMGPRWQ